MYQLSFYKNPFVYLTTFYIIGLWFGSLYFDWEVGIIFSLSTILFVLFDWNFRSSLGDFFSKIIIPCMFFTLGYWSIYLSEFKGYDANLPANEPVTIEFCIQELESTTTKQAQRGIGIIHQIKTATNQFPVRERILFYIDSAMSYQVGDRLIATTRLIPIENKGNPGEFNQVQFWKNQHIHFSTYIDNQDVKWIDFDEPSFFRKQLNAIHDLLSQILQENLANQELALAQALILGDKSLLNKETKSAFSATGAMHVLAVSGMHIALILQLLLYISSFFYRFISRQRATILIVSLLWTYAVLTGFSPSVIRAVFTFSLLALAQLSGKNYHPINILFFSALILLVIEPLFIFDIGFQLSYLAMIGIYLVYEPIYNWFTPKNLILNYFWQGTAVGFAAQVMTIPLMLYYFHQFPNYFILSNLILLVLSGIILGSGMSLFVTWKIPVLNKVNVFVLFIALWFSLVSLTWIESLPGAVAYGFEFPFIIVPLMTISIYLLIYFLPFSKLWIATALMFTLLLSWVIILRWENLSTSHLVFFNHSKLTFALKNKDNIHCFVDAKPEDLKKSTFLLDAYSKCYPGNITWHSIKGNNGLFIVGSDTLKWQSLQDQKIITWKNSEIRVQFSATGDHEEVDIFMPWIEHPKSLKQGAIFYN